MPEIPPEWNAPYYWHDLEDIETELLRRFRSKYTMNGKSYGNIGINGHDTGLITALERGTVLVEYYTDKDGNWEKSGECISHIQTTYAADASTLQTSAKYRHI